MTEPVQIAVIAATPPTLLALTGIAVAVVNNRHANRSLTSANNRIEQLEARVVQLLPKTKADLSTLAVEPNDKGH